MEASWISERARQFVARHIDSAARLEILLALRDRPGETWTVQSAARELRMAEAAVSGHLEQLTEAGALREDEGYRFAPRSAAVSEAVDDLAEAFSRRRLKVIELIYAEPGGQVQSFADAFRLRRKKG